MEDHSRYKWAGENGKYQDKSELTSEKEPNTTVNRCVKSGMRGERDHLPLPDPLSLSRREEERITRKDGV